MMKIPKAVSDVIDSFHRLPGIGPKSAQRLAFYLLHIPDFQINNFVESLVNLKKLTKICNLCKNVDDVDPCSICEDQTRDKNTILVVEQPLDLIAFEKTNKYKGLYHVLHGVINPLENIGPDEIYIDDLLKRLNGIDEIIIATNPTMEGEATSMYLKNKIKERQGNIKITRLGVGIPTGADLEYADDHTLFQALEGRKEL